jgi:hypothetical protein
MWQIFSQFTIVVMYYQNLNFFHPIWRFCEKIMKIFKYIKCSESYHISIKCFTEKRATHWDSLMNLCT